MSLETPILIRTLQRKLYLKAKAEPAYRWIDGHLEQLGLPHMPKEQRVRELASAN